MPAMMVPLGELCEIASGGTPRRSIIKYWENGSIPWLKISDLVGKHISAAEETITDTGLENSSAKLFEPGTVLVSIFATIGVASILDIPATTNQAIAGIKPLDCTKLSPEYLYYWIIAQKNKMAASGRGVAQNNINLSYLRSMQILLPDMERQQSIIAIFSKFDKLFESSKGQLQRLDDLVKSRFVEMFDSEKFELVKLGGYCERVTKGATPTTLGYHYQDNGINFIKVESLAEYGSIVADKVAHISDECNEAMRRSQLRVGDIVFSIAGAIGRTAIIPDSILPASTNQALAIIRLRSPLAFDRIFLRYALISSDVTRSISSSKRGIAQVNLSLTDIKNLRVPLPPLALQQEFAAFVSQVDKLRFEACYAMYLLCAAFTLL